MMGEDKHEARRIFTAALALETREERARYLDEACRGKPELRRRVEALLRAHDQAGGFLEQTMPMPPPSDLEVERTGVTICSYKLLEEIGEGGFGQVYMAEQKEPVHRKVALKIIKAGMDTKEVVARFEAERQALALMDHPNIAQVFDGGVTQAGRPYFVMELVKGIPITDYCDRHDLPMADRLQLFMQVCHAVQHAHQKGIIHRDLKPGNILVTLIDGKPVPKIIDFGVAKALGQQLTEKTLFTAFEQIIGTPAYMSPEQTAISGVDVDTRSDIYSLGVLLYELLTGVTPFDAETFRKVGLDEVRRMIRETDPPMPSTRLRTLGDKLTDVAHHRHAEPSTLTRMVHGDLDWIVMKALEKDRERRYEAAEVMAMDVQRHLDSVPIMARPPRVSDRLHKLVRRHKLAFAGVLAVAGSLVVGGAASVWLAHQATQAQRKAETAAAREAALRLQAEAKEKMAMAQSRFAEGRIEEADELLRDLATGFTEQDAEKIAPILHALAHWHAGAKRWQRSAAYYDMLLYGPASQSAAAFDNAPWILEGSDSTMTLNPLAHTLAYLEYAPLLIETGDLEGYERLRDSAAVRYSNPAQPLSGERLLHACLLRPVSENHRASVCKWVLTLRQMPFRTHYDCTAMALFEYRRGNEDQGLEWAQICLGGNPPPAFDARARIIAAMAYARLNQREKARNELTQCREVIDGKFDGELGVGNYGADLWADWLIDRVLLREADMLLASEPTTHNAAAAAAAASAEAAQRRAWDEAMGDAIRELSLSGASGIEEISELADHALTASDEQERTRIMAGIRALAHWHAGAQRWRQSAACYDMLLFGPVSQFPEVDDPVFWPLRANDSAIILQRIPRELAYLEYAPLLVSLNDLDDYEQLRDLAVSIYSSQDQPITAEVMLHACLLQPVPQHHRVAVCKWASALEAVESKSLPMLTALALFEHRRGNAEGTLEWTTIGLDQNPPPAFAARFRIIAALADVQLNRREEALGELAQCRQVIEGKLQGELGVGRYGADLWADWLIDRVLLREADGLLASPAPDAEAAATGPGVMYPQRQQWDAAMARAKEELAVSAGQSTEAQR